MSEPPEDVAKILGPNESVQLYIQQKVFHPKINIDSVVITNERVILRQPHTLGLRKDYVDYNYQDIANVILDKGILRSGLRFTLRFGGEPLSLADLPNDLASKAYGIVRENLVRFQTPFSTGQQGVGPFSQSARASLCAKCGAPLQQGQKFCGSCGSPV